MNQIKGVVQTVESKEIEIGGKPFIKHMITIDSDGSQMKVLKFTQPKTNFSVPTGTTVSINAQEQTDKYGNITYKVDSKPENFILLNGSKSQPQQSSGPSSATRSDTKLSSSTTLGNERPKYDPDGQKRGNAITNAVNLLIHSKGKSEITSKDSSRLLELARMVYKVSSELEKSPSTETIEDDETNPFI